MEKITSRQIILETSEALFNAWGFHAVGVDRIREVSGVSKVTLYKYFASKRDLVMAVLQIRDARFIDSLEKYVADGHTVDEKIALFIDWHLNWFSQPTFNGCMFVNASKELGVSDEPVQQLVREHKQRVFRIIVDMLPANSAAARAVAGMLFIYTEGAISEAALNGCHQRIAASKEAFIAGLLRSLADSGAR